MIKIIEYLKEQRNKAEKTFIEHSLIKRVSLNNSCIPDVDSDLNKIAEFNEAINVLENYMTQKR